MPKANGATTEPVVPGGAAATDTDEEFFKTHGIEDAEEKEFFRKDFLRTKYRQYREKKEQPAAPEKKPFFKRYEK